MSVVSVQHMSRKRAQTERGSRVAHDPTDYTECRTLGHAWDQVPYTDATAPSRGATYLALRCVRCTTERFDEIQNSTGEVRSRYYRYPEGYHLSRDDSLSRSEWRHAYLRLIGLVSNGSRRRAS